MIRYWPYGFYEYGDQQFVLKEAALAAALHKHDPDPKIKFNFNHDVFGRIDWQTEPTSSINDLYKDRAQQLRDQYSYLILMYSGGSDSRQVLHSFLDNGIFLDEVVTIHPQRLMSSTPVVADPEHSHAFLFEFDLTTVPGLKDISARSPKTKITVVDSSDDIQNLYGNESYWADRQPSSRLGSGYWTVSTNAGQQHARRASDKHSSAAVIYGCDKPNVCLRQGHLYFFFVDTGFAGSQSQRHTNPVNFDAVSFFSAADAPLIPVKQSHMIRRALSQVPALYRAFSMDGRTSWNPRLREITKHIVYPSWDTKIFQANKLSHFTFEDCRDFLQRVDPRIYQAQISRKKHFNGQYNLISTISNKHIFMIHSPSPEYFVGTVQEPLPKGAH